MARFDTVIVGGVAVLPVHGPVRADIGIKDGRIAAIGEFAAAEGGEAVDADGKLVLPGAVDAHFHIGIYRDLASDARSETASAVTGGVTTVISYFRTGQHYLGVTGPYREILPQVVALTQGNAYCDVGYHLAPMTGGQVAEIPELAAHGTASFKYYMFYKGMNLAGDARDDRGAAAYTMSDSYDLGHLYQIMEKVAEANAAHDDRRVSLSIHAEQPELIRIFVDRAAAAGYANPLEEYSNARPPFEERVAIHEAALLAARTGCPINFLHLSSAEALEAALEVKRRFPGLDIRTETTLHHLALSYERYADQRGKVNPPIRSDADAERLWQGVRSGEIDWVVSDHACCSEENKRGPLWSALPGFGGTALLYPLLLTEGRRRGLPLERMVDLACTAPARAYGLVPRKGALLVGGDADIVVVDVEAEEPVTARRLGSAQEYTPFEGIKLTGWPVRTLVRGRTVYRDGAVVGDALGAYLERPVAG
ncbi:MAG: amidohydrolase family protein [Streptosporangiales bacterium]|nr:amidohydrolase family protein [Streptosporangiales bacterium]